MRMDWISVRPTEYKIEQTQKSDLDGRKNLSEARSEDSARWEDSA